MLLNDLCSSLISYTKTARENPDITSMEMDSRKVTPGSLFVCIKGYTVDGHEYAGEAVKKGAAALLAERELDVNVPVIVVRDVKRAMAVLSSVFYNHPTRKMRLIGITGTNGKTTTTHLIDHVLKDSGQHTGMVGTLYTKIGEETIENKNTTPESLVLQQTFGKMVSQNIETCTMEVSSHALDLGRVRGCDFDIAVFTNLTKDHLDYHETMEAYKQAKGLLFAQLGNHYEGRGKTAVLNADDPASSLYERMTSAQVLTYGIKNESDIKAENIAIRPWGTSFEAVTPWGKETFSLKLIGMFSVYNALAAITASLLSNISLADIKRSLEAIEGVDGRFETVDAGQDFTVVVDYAHTPDSLENVLKTVKEMAEKNIYVIVGCGGDRDKTKRPEMAAIASEFADTAIFTSDNPRSEDPKAILEDMVKGVEKSNYTVIESRKEAIEHAVHSAAAKDIIVIAGKGHETYQIIGSEVLTFDDREEARKAIKKIKADR
ncbi:UDP-N-acetylmuramoyl-L-alanyl-D-glutamate--2,6-diaminopimelate ligase [Thalassorhabdus alkalitolerans]|uniref:UDP-N-acetylmuramoyl-L-alanyl-D-glutamate--2,6-diaminopimelate ligase n=1 Tax=Thalassorhabdus alkalitolerans TaxID=2282697 RepID=A0ABW0YP38_9BACI